MTSSTKKTLRQEMLEIVRANGWVLDTSVMTSGNNWSTQYNQDLHAFIKEAAHGGQWQIKLDYEVKGSYSNTIGDRLQGIKIRYIAPGTPTEEFTYGAYRSALDSKGRQEAREARRVVTVQRPAEYINPLAIDTDNEMIRSGQVVLKGQSKYDDSQETAIWRATGRDETGEIYYAKGGNARTLRQRAEILVRNIDLAIWVAAEIQYNDRVRRQQQLDARKLDAQERARNPHGVAATVIDWRKAVAELSSAASALQRADGKTTRNEMSALMIRLREAQAAVEGMVN